MPAAAMKSSAPTFGVENQGYFKQNSEVELQGVSLTKTWGEASQTDQQLRRFQSSRREKDLGMELVSDFRV